MPAVVPAVAGALAGALGGGLSGTIAANVILGLGGSFILSSLSRALLPGAKRPALGALAAGRQDMVRQPVTARRTIYGRAFVSGPLVYVQTYGSIDGLPNIHLSLLVALAGHACDAIEEVWFNDRACAFLADGVTAGDPFSTRAKADPEGGPDIVLDAEGIDFAQVYRHLGSADQAADSRLVADSGGKWTAEHRLRGIAYVHARLRFDRLESLFHDGAPEVRCLVRGKPVLDPRTAVTAWSDNPALCVYDFLRGALGIADADVDEASVIAAANVCDEAVALKGGGTEKRYTANGTVDADARPADVLRDLLGAMAGTLVYTGGRFVLHAGAAATPTLTLAEGDHAGGMTVYPRTARRELFNAVKAVYVSRRDGWQPRTAPVVGGAGFAAEDGGQEILQAVELPFTTTATAAQRLAKIELLRARQQIVVEATVKLVGLKLRAWDTVALSDAELGWSAKPFRVVGWRLNEDASVALTLREEAASMWAWSSSDEGDLDPAPDTALPSPFAVPAPGTVAVTESLGAAADGTVLTMLAIAVGAVADGFVDAYQVQVRKVAPATGPWVQAGSGDGTAYAFGPVDVGATYQVRARAQNALGARSRWTTVSHTVAGLVDPPDDVTGFAADIRGAEALLSWQAVASPALSHYRVRWSPETAGASWSGAVDLVARVARPATSVAVPALVGTYLIKAVDARGRESLEAAAIVSTIAGVASLNAVESVTENPVFAGTHDGTVAVDGALKLDTATAFDTGAGDVDAMGGLFDGGGGAGAVVAEGVYGFAGAVDLGKVFTSRLTALIGVAADDYALTFDDAPGDFDDRGASFDGAVIAQVNAGLEVRTTEDDPGGAPTWADWRGFVVGDYRARAFQFRARLTSANANASPVVGALAVTVDMPDRTVEEHDLASGAGAHVVAFPGGAFRAPPAVGVSAQGLATGDFYEIAAKGPGGFTITFRNAAGTSVSRTFDYLAKGYGRAG